MSEVTMLGKATKDDFLPHKCSYKYINSTGCEHIPRKIIDPYPCLSYSLYYITG